MKVFKMSFMLVLLLLRADCLVGVNVSESNNGYHEPPAKIPRFQSIEQLCRIFSIPEQNCTCEIFMVSSNNKESLSSLCNQTSNAPIKPKVFIKPEPALLYGLTTLLASIIALIGNSYVAYIGRKKRESSHSVRKIHMHLSVVHLVVVFISLLKNLPAFWTSSWVYGVVMCKAINGGGTFALLLTVGFLLVIAIERYLSIIHPMEKNKRSWLRILIGGNIWAACLFSIPSVVFTTVTEHSQICKEKWPRQIDSSLYPMLLSVVYFFLPLFAAILLSTLAYHHLHKQTQWNRNSNVSIEKHEIVKNHERSLHLLAAMIFAHALCIAPYRILSVYFRSLGSGLHKEVNHDLYHKLAYTAMMPYTFYFAINPILYAFFDKTWRRDFKQQLQCCGKSKRKCATLQRNTSVDQGNELLKCMPFEMKFTKKQETQN